MGPVQYATGVTICQQPNAAVEKLIFRFLIREVPGKNPGQKAGFAH
jgi:hypothetical protein